MNLIFLALLCGVIATSFLYKSEARLHAESIVGGTVSFVYQNTYAVSIQVNGKHMCGGGILNNRYIITVAHCYINLKTNRFKNVEYTVVAGATNAHDKEQRYRVMRKVAKIYILREYNPIVRDLTIDDIAVLELASDLGLNLFITNVILPPNAMPHPTYENQQAVVCGYGHNWVTMRHDRHTNQDVEVCSGSYCYERRLTQVNILSNMVCRNSFRDLRDSQLCGRMMQRSRAQPEGLCSGDSGAPLVIGNTIIGVVSGSPSGCREDLAPAVYTRVTSFIPFIINAMNGHQAANMRLATYEVIGCGLFCKKKVFVE